MSVQTQEIVRTNWKTRLEKCEDWEVMRLRRHTLIRRDEKLMLVSGSENLFPWFSRWRRARKADERKSVAALVFLSFGGMEGTTPPPPPNSEPHLGGGGGGLSWGLTSSTKGLSRGLELGLRDVSWLSSAGCWYLQFSLQNNYWQRTMLSICT